MKKSYFHLSAEELAATILAYRQGKSVRTIAQLLARNQSTVSPELRRAQA